MMLYESIQAFSEVYALAEVTGFPPDKLHEVFRKYKPQFQFSLSSLIM